MAMENIRKLQSTDPEIRLSQFLYVGKEYPNYQPGNWFFHNYFLAKNVMSIHELADNPEKQLVPIQLILQAFENNLAPNPETLVFALAVCCRQTKSENLRHAAYTTVAKICRSPQQFILFIKFFSELKRQNELMENSITNSWGHGLRKAVNNWYLSKEPLELAKCITICKGKYGWKHKDIIKLSHPHPNNKEHEAVLKYIMHGLKEAEKLSLENLEVTQIIKYIQEIEEFKHCTDEVEAAGLLESYQLTLDHVPGHLLKSKEVWNSLISSMNLNMLLHNLQRIHNLEILKPNSPTVDKVIDQLTNEQYLSRDKVHPALVLITIRNYENSGKPLSYEKRKVKEQAKKPLPPPPKPNSKIVDALYKTLNLSFSHLQPTGLRYMITINMNKAMFEGHAWRSGNVSGAEAGCMIALALLHCEKNVTVATFKNLGIHTVNIDKTASFGQAMKRLQQTPVGIVNLGKPISWATNQNSQYDVFINIVDRIFEKSDASEKAMETYRKKLKLPCAKLINCAVCSSSTYHKESHDVHTLMISGFDATVPMVIQAFAKSLF